MRSNEDSEMPDRICRAYLDACNLSFRVNETLCSYQKKISAFLRLKTWHSCYILEARSSAVELLFIIQSIRIDSGLAQCL